MAAPTVGVRVGVCLCACEGHQSVGCATNGALSTRERARVCPASCSEMPMKGKGCDKKGDLH